MPYGHFNRNRAFGVADTYPDATQFITVLRDPFEMACSSYFFTRRAGRKWKDRSRVPQADLATYLDTTPPNMLNRFPCVVTETNYRAVMDAYFISIGITERLAESMARIAAALGRGFVAPDLKRRNPTERDDADMDLGALRARYRANHPLEFAVYDHARWMFEYQPAVQT